MNLRPRARCYLAGRRRLDQLDIVVRATYDGFWLGAFETYDLHEIDRRYYAGSPVFTTAAHNERGLFGWEEAAIERWFTGVERVAVLAAGGGREVVALRKAGIDADGYEPNSELRGVANELLRSHGHEPCVHPCTRDVVPRLARPCDAAIVGWGALSNMSSSTVRQAFLRELGAALPARSPILLSFLTRRPDNEYARRVAAVATRIRRLRRRGGPEPGDVLQPNFVHLFSLEEAVGEARAAGLDLCASGDDGYGWAVARAPSAATIAAPAAGGG